MIKNVSIRNFKSIKKLDFKAKRVNVFIGEPNTGKSNILEALGIFSIINNEPGQMPIRYESVANLFYDNEQSDECPISVSADNLFYQIKNNQLAAVVKGDNTYPAFNYDFATGQQTVFPESQNLYSLPIRLYSFKLLKSFSSSPLKFLRPPYGQNLFQVLMANKTLKVLVSSIIKDLGYKLGLRLKDKEIEMIKEVEDVIYAYPYQTISDTLQRIIFYWAVIETNKNATILLEEPESHMSPYYIRDIADRIAHDTDNQYFLVTHNPYFLVTLVEKTKLSDLSVSVTYLDDYQTKLKQLTKKDLEEVTDLDTSIFFNLDKFTEVESIV